MRKHKQLRSLALSVVSKQLAKACADRTKNKEWEDAVISRTTSYALAATCKICCEMQSSSLPFGQTYVATDALCSKRAVNRIRTQTQIKRSGRCPGFARWNHAYCKSRWTSSITIPIDSTIRHITSFRVGNNPTLPNWSYLCKNGGLPPEMSRAMSRRLTTPYNAATSKAL